MREMYQIFVEGGREIATLAMEYTAETVPFYEATPVIDYKGKQESGLLCWSSTTNLPPPLLL